MEGTIGEIRMFAGTFSPRTWAFCNGQLISIAQNTALFSILGTTYGGNGQTTLDCPISRAGLLLVQAPDQGCQMCNLVKKQEQILLHLQQHKCLHIITR